MSDNLKKQICVRAGHRSVATKTANKISELISGYSIENESQLKALDSVLREKIDVLKKLDDEILIALEPEEIENEIEKSTGVMEQLNIALFETEKCLKSTKIENELNSSSLSATGGVKKGVRLPKLELKKFSGDPKNWQSWWDAYSSAIHENEDLTKIDKMNYLRSLLQGGAIQAIQGLGLSAENYDDAIEILHSRFGKKLVVISSHMDALMKVSTIKSIQDTRGLRNLYDRVESHIRSLRAMGIDSTSYGCLLVPVIMSRLPDDLKLILTRTLDPEADAWEIDDLLKEFQAEVAARERVSHVAAGESAPLKNDKNAHLQNSRQERRTIPTAAGLLATSKKGGGAASNRGGSGGGNSGANSGDGASGEGPTCAFCEEKHQSATCANVTDVEERRTKLMKSGRCFLCLSNGHLARSCKSKQKCSYCNRRHHKSLCAEEVEDSTSALVTEEENVVEEDVVEVKPSKCNEIAGQLIVDSSTSSLLMTAKVSVGNVNKPEKSIVARIVIDGGSHKSHITTKLQKQLELKSVGSKFLNVGTFGERKGKIRRTDTVQLKLSNFENDEEIVITACTTPVICPPMNNKKVKIALQNFHHLRGLELADGDVNDENGDIDILIGQDYYWIVMRDPIIRGEINEPVAQLSIFGWILSGAISDDIGRESDQEQQLLIRTEEKDDLKAQLEAFWRVESFGIAESEEEEEDVVNSMFLKSITYDGKRYEVSLPWRKNAGVVGDNFLQAKSRLASVKRKLMQNAPLKEEYVNNFVTQIDSGILERVIEDKPPAFGNCYYMPHHPVVKLERETTKVRIVYDASSKTSGRSLNQALHQGPSLLPEIFKILLRFRCHEIALVADIEKAFLNISVSEKDRDFLRLLWFKKPDDLDSQIEIYRFTRVVFGVTCSPYHLNATLRFHIMKYVEKYPESLEAVINSLYVDEFQGGAKNDEKTVELYKALTEIMPAGGFNMRKWASNSAEVRKLFPKPDAKSSLSETYAECTIANPEACNDEILKKVLGVVWDTESDDIIYTFAALFESLKSLPKTKRGLLGVIARIYDPIGLVSPVTVKLKASFQTLCISKLEWDDPLSEDLLKLWNLFLSGVRDARPIRVPRCYLKLGGGEIRSVQLHTFVDASDLAYAAVCYLRIDQGGLVHTSPVAAKSRVAPLKIISSPRPQLTTPRLELLAAVVGSKLSETVQSVLSTVVPIQSIRFWSDSMTVLYWIRGEGKEYKQFVENRLTKIRSRSKTLEWQHVPGEENPADIGSRGSSVEELASSSLWLEGPQWLRQDEENWPRSVTLERSTPEALQEMKAETLRNEDIEQTRTLIVTEVFECESKSTLKRLLRVTAFVIRFLKNIQRRLKKEATIAGMLSSEEMQDAEKYWIRVAQRVLESQEDFKRKSMQFGMYRDAEDVIRCRSRMTNADLEESSKMPIALPHDHWLSNLIVRDSHERVFHNGVGETVSLVKTKYFIPRCRQIAKRLIKSCVICRYVDAKPYNWRPDPPLPEFRVSVDEPFSAVGVDLAGPMYVKPREVDGRSNSKAYIVLFTCAGTRGIHLELVDDCSSKRFICALRRFIGRRGTPHTLVSDNATNFAAKETQSFLTDRKILWQPTISNAPWYGGMYERMVRVVKRCLKKVLQGAKLSLDELNTVVIEVEAIVNDRPLTYVDNEEFHEAITPNHLIIGHRLNTMNDQQCDAKREIKSECSPRVRQRLRHKLKVLDDFRRRWKKEYLLDLRDVRKAKQVGSNEEVAIGDVVIVEDDGPRLMWKLGRITSLIKSKDGNNRAAKVLVTGPKKLTELERPIRKLYPLELSCESQNETYKNVNSLKSNGLSTVLSTDPQKVVPIFPIANNDMITTPSISTTKISENAIDGKLGHFDGKRGAHLVSEMEGSWKGTNVVALPKVNIVSRLDDQDGGDQNSDAQGVDMDDQYHSGGNQNSDAQRVDMDDHENGGGDQNTDAQGNDDRAERNDGFATGYHVRTRRQAAAARGISNDPLGK